MIRSTIISFGLAMLIIFSYLPCSFAQETIKKEDRVKLKASLTAPYLLGPGDQIYIQDRTLADIMATNKLEEYDVLVNGDGTISLPLPSGRQISLDVVGLTLDEVSKEVIAEYSKILKYPVVFVRMGKRRAVKVFVAGAVEKPGIYKLDDTEDREKGGMWETEQKTNYTEGNVVGFPLFQVLQLVGGLKPRADISMITVTRGNGLDKIVFDLQKLINGEAPLDEFNLLSGDAVFVPIASDAKLQAQNHSELLGWLAYQKVPVTVVGEAKKTGNFVLDNDSTILDAIGSAGGLNEVGTLKKIRLSRFDTEGKYNTTVLNVHDLIRGDATRDELKVMPGDSIEVVASKGKLVRHFFDEHANALIQALIFPAVQSYGNYLSGDALKDTPSRVIQVSE